MLVCCFRSFGLTAVALPTTATHLITKLPRFSSRTQKQDDDTAVLWWVLQQCDASAWRPSPAEAEGNGAEKGWAKNRNLLLPWAALEAALVQVGCAGVCGGRPVCRCA